VWRTFGYTVWTMQWSTRELVTNKSYKIPTIPRGYKSNPLDVPLSMAKMSNSNTVSAKDSRTHKCVNNIVWLHNLRTGGWFRGQRGWLRGEAFLALASSLVV
jgi:hypothetical protein